MCPAVDYALVNHNIVGNKAGQMMDGCSLKLKAIVKQMLPVCKDHQGSALSLIDLWPRVLGHIPNQIPLTIGYMKVSICGEHNTLNKSNTKGPCELSQLF